MGKAFVLVCCVLCVACGRIGFDPFGLAGGDARGDGNGDGGPSGDGPPLLSCLGLASTCGPGGTSSCCGSPLVPGGAYYRSYDLGADNAFSDMTSPATLSDFRLDRYEVTVGRFRQFVSAGMGTQTTPPTVGAGARTLNGVAGQGGWDPSWNTSLATDTSALVAAVKCDMAHESWTDIQGGNEAVPMNCVTWFEAMAFCVWDGGFLPTEAEWNYAAAGGGEQRAYPWSIPANDVTLDCSHANYFNGTAYCASPPNGAVNRVGSESPRGDGRWGQSDLAGNLWEWALDWSQAVYATPCGDCANLTVATNRIVRSTGFYAIAASLRNGERDKDLPASRRYALGVRCARAP